MFCPRCGQERISEETSFCSRCGYLLTATADLLLTDGISTSRPLPSRSDSPRWRGVKQGAFLIMLAIVLAPILGVILRFGLNMMPWPMGLIVFLLGGSGFLRIAYALMFEEGGGAAPTESESRPHIGPAMTHALEEGDASVYISPERSPRLQTNDLAEPHSVTDPTTKLLEKNRE
jgi:hypothetical protein